MLVRSIGKWGTRKCSLSLLQCVSLLTVFLVAYDHIHVIVLPSGEIVAKQMSSSVPQSVLKQIHRWSLEKLSYKDIVSRLRCRTVPPGYTIHTWIPGELSGVIGDNYNYLQQAKKMMLTNFVLSLLNGSIHIKFASGMIME